MGGMLETKAGDRVAFEILAEGRPGTRYEIVQDGEAREGAVKFDLVGDGAAHWVRVNVRDSDGRLLMIGNPIYLSQAGNRRQRGPVCLSTSARYQGSSST